jgi:hypothetical protein
VEPEDTHPLPEELIQRMIALDEFLAQETTDPVLALLEVGSENAPRWPRLRDCILLLQCTGRRGAQSPRQDKNPGVVFLPVY